MGYISIYMGIIWNNIWLVVSIYPSKKEFVSWDDEIPQYMEKMFQTTGPWLTQDPWSKAIASAPPAAPAQPAAHVIHELEQRLEQNLLAKLPTEPDKMETDEHDQRLTALEQQMHMLTSRQTNLETTVKDNHAQSAAQVQSLQQQMLVQMGLQSKQMQNMLTDQMTRLESILSKKPRTE